MRQIVEVESKQNDATWTDMLLVAQRPYDGSVI